MKLRQRAALAMKVLTGDTLGNSLGTVLRNYSTQSSFRPTEQVQGITYKAIDKFGLMLSDYAPIVKKANGDAVENHPLYLLAANPNPRYTASDFIHLYGMLFKIYGETFWYKARGESSGKVKELYLLNPAQIELKIDDGELLGYILHKASGEQVPFTPEEIYHDKSPNPFNEWRGMSVLERASLYVDTEIVTSQFTLNYMKNNASPSGIVSLPAMSTETFKQFTMQWRENYEGPLNAGKTAFIRGEEASFQAVGATLKDVDQKITREMAKEDVLMMLDMPRELLGWAKDGGLGRDTYAAAYYVFTETTLDPTMRRLDRIYQSILDEMSRPAGTALQTGKETVSHESPVPEDKEHKLLYQEKATNNWITINEARALDGLDPITDGDKIKDKQPVAMAPAKSDPVDNKAKRVVLKAAPTQKDLHEDQEAFRSKLVETNEIYFTKMKREMSRFAGQQEAKVIANINASSKVYEDWLFEVKEDSEKLALLLIPIVIALMEEQGKDVANFITGELLTLSPEARKAAEINIKQIAGVYNVDTLRALETTLAEGQANGESLVKLKKRVEQVYQDAKGYRAERIARTESMKASNGSAEMVYKQNGFTKVAWFVNPGACQWCQPFAGREKTIGATFVNNGDVVTGSEGGQMRIDYQDIITPPLHTNCTCSLVPVE